MKSHATKYQYEYIWNNDRHAAQTKHVYVLTGSFAGWICRPQWGRLYSKTCRAEVFFTVLNGTCSPHSGHFAWQKVLKERLFLILFHLKNLEIQTIYEQRSSNSNAAIAIMLATEVHVVAEICATHPSITKIATIHQHLGLLLLNGLKKITHKNLFYVGY